MQIKERPGSNRIQLYRTYYDPTKKRSYQRMVGSIPRHSRTIPADLDGWPDAERQEVQAWLDARAEREQEALQRGALALAPYQLQRLTEVLADDTVPADLEQLAAIGEALKATSAALRRRIRRAQK